MNWTPEQWAAVITAASAAVGSLIVQIIRTLRETQHHEEVKAMLAPMVAPLTPGAVPSGSIGQVLRFLDYAMVFAAQFEMVRGLQPGEDGEVHKIRTLIDHKDYTIGPTPVHRNR